MHRLVSAHVDSSRRWIVLAIVAAAQFMFGVDAFVVSVPFGRVIIALRRRAARYIGRHRAVHGPVVPDRAVAVRSRCARVALDLAGDGGMPLIDVAVLLTIFGFGQGLMMSPLSSAVLSTVKPASAGSGAGTA